MEASSNNTQAFKSIQDLADFTIKFGNEERRVHRVVLAHRSEYFAKLFRNDFEESSNRAITLEDDKPEVVELMLDYFYDLDYQAGPRITQNLSELEIHACVYGIGEKYGLEGLKSLARKKFAEHAHTAAVTHQNFLLAIRPIFSMTPSSDRGLRDMAVNIWLFIAAGAEEQMKDEVEAIMFDVPDFARSIAQRLAPLCSKVLLEGACRCGEDKFVGGQSHFEAFCLNCRRPAKEAVTLFIRPRVEIEPFW